MELKAKKILVLGAVAMATMVALAPPTHAQGWEYSFAPYGWVAGLDGAVTTRGVTAAAEVDFADIFENLETGALLHFEAAQGDWTVLADLVFLGIGQTTDRLQIDVDVDQLILELGAGYALTDTFEVLFGGRYVDIDVEADFSGPVLNRIAGDQSWVDPFVGGRFQSEINDKWWFNFRGDVGGFGVGSDFTWNAAVHFVYELNDRTALGLGYRILDIDYEDGQGLSRFAYDMETSGPQVGVEFRF
ncbi:MAG: hypothetical protein OES47_12745 [Acidobacteriota bacterium]|nr:hypothetical protein [Acidobacteriota bacterium]